MILKCHQASEPWIKTRTPGPYPTVSDSAGLGRAPRIYISNEFPGHTDAAQDIHLEHHLCVHVLNRTFGPLQSTSVTEVAQLAHKARQNKDAATFSSKGFSLSVNMSLLLTPIGLRTELMIYFYDKFAYAKNYAKSKLGTRFYGPSSKPHKIRV